MAILTGGPHLYVDQVPAEGPRACGYQHGLENRTDVPKLYDRADRAAYFQGHIRGCLERIKQQRTAPPAPQPIHVEPWEMSA